MSAGFCAINRLFTTTFLHLSLFYIAIVVPHLFTPDQAPRHFDERMLKEVAAPSIKIEGKGGVKKELKLVERDGRKVWKLVKEGGDAPPAGRDGWRRRGEGAPKKEEPPVHEFLFDPPTPDDQIEFQEKLLEKQDIDLRVPRDVYVDYHKKVRKYADSKKVNTAKTTPAEYYEIKHNDDNMYRAIAYALAGSELLHDAVRDYVADYYSEFNGKWEKREQQKWMDEFDIGTTRRHAARVRDGDRGNTPDLIATAKKLNINILVYNNKKDRWTCMSPRTVHKDDLEMKGDCQDKNRPTIALEFIDNEHYDVILDVKEKKK